MHGCFLSQSGQRRVGECNTVAEHRQIGNEHTKDQQLDREDQSTSGS